LSHSPLRLPELWLSFVTCYQVSRDDWIVSSALGLKTQPTAIHEATSATTTHGSKHLVLVLLHGCMAVIAASANYLPVGEVDSEIANEFLLGNHIVNFNWCCWRLGEVHATPWSCVRPGPWSFGGTPHLLLLLLLLLPWGLLLLPWRLLLLLPWRLLGLLPWRLLELLPWRLLGLLPWRLLGLLLWMRIGRVKWSPGGGLLLSLLLRWGLMGLLLQRHLMGLLLSCGRKGLLLRGLMALMR
jgi:hypothetical protein